MNLYRSFGNLMEAWVNEDRTYFEPDMSGDNSEDPLAPPSDMGNNPRSESVDSGVETTSCYSPCPATSCSVSTDNTETDLFVLQSNETTLASTSQSSVLSSPGPCSSSSSSPRLGLSRAEEVSTALHQKVEQALQRTDAKHLMRSTEVLRRQPAGTFLLKQHTSDSVRCQRSDSCGPRRRVSSLVGIRQMSERRPLSVECEKLRSEDFGVKEKKELSPGLCYLEEVCQMLEGIAKQQMQNRPLETDAVWEHKDIQAEDSCQSDSTAAEEEPSSCDRTESGVDEVPAPCERLENAKDSENISNKPQQQKNQHFRRRSASDTALTMLHLRKVNKNCRGQQLSTDDLLEAVEEDKVTEDLTKRESIKTKKTWKLKVRSLRRAEYALSDSKGQQTQLLEKNPISRRLSQLFRRRKAALPV